ncbi:MAG: gliding motility-associated C-terminal domain-containing protein [Flavobacteriales bacterium]|nr:gliding motility-associated C-terminal domain-containing protein [Flavobacteriales bacterium]
MNTPSHHLSVILAVLVLATTATAQSLQTTTYYKVTAYKSGENAISSVSNEVEVIQYFDIFIPNTFTPNNDNLNDTFKAVSGRLSSFSMLIFNKWGELLYETDDINAPWDGTYNGETVQPDSYVYKISAMGTELGAFEKSGTVTVLL